MSTMKITIKSILFGSLLGLPACGGAEPGALPESAGPADVVVSRAAHAEAAESFPATVTAEREADLATRMSGTILEMAVDVGVSVRAGQVLVRVEASDVEARVESARAHAELAERSFRRVENLHADRAASDQELDEVRARLDAARAALRDAEAQLGYAVVRAPFDGFVAARMADPGDLAAPGRPLLRVVGSRSLQVEADLPAERAGQVAVGDPVTVNIPGAGMSAPGRIRRVVPALAPGSRRFRVEVAFEPSLPVGGRVVPGAYARIERTEAGDGAPTAWIPEDAVIRRGQLTGVFALEGRELRLRWLRLGRARDGAVEVLAGPPGELTVVRRPGPTLRDGQPVGEVTSEAFEVVKWEAAA